MLIKEILIESDISDRAGEIAADAVRGDKFSDRDELESALLNALPSFPDKDYDRSNAIERALEILYNDDMFEGQRCWKGYEKKGTKILFGKRVNNCVKKEDVQLGPDGQLIFAENLDENLKKWFQDKWVRFGPDGKIRGDCARGSKSEGKPKCLPRSKAQALGKKGRKKAASRKRREDPNKNRRGKAKNVKTK